MKRTPEQVKKAVQNRLKQKSELGKKAEKELKSLLSKGKKPRAGKVWHTVHFRRPKTLILRKAPKYPRHSVPKTRALDKYQMLRYPVTTETIMKLIEEQNTIVFITDNRATKPQIKKAFGEMYGVKVETVRTLIKPDGEKKAFIKLPQDVEAVEIASKIGIC